MYIYIYIYNNFVGCNLTVTVHHAGIINKYIVKPKPKCRYLKAVLHIAYFLDP